MREELIINGQHCDLSAETGVTLEYVSNLLSGPGKISLSHSYTIKLPRTANNARILDLPEIPAHDSSMARRYLPVHYYRNGINLIGNNAHAYITGASPEHYELVLVWDDIPELRALSESDATINDLPNLPRLSWVGNSYGVESDGALFAKYISSNVPKDTSTVNNLIHPCMRMRNLLTRVLENAGVSYELPEDALKNDVLLAAPGHSADIITDKNVGLSFTIDGGDLGWHFRDMRGTYSTQMYMLYGRNYSNTAANSNGISLRGDISANLGNVTLLNGKSSCIADVHFKIVDSPIDLTGLSCQIVCTREGTPGMSLVLATIPLIKEPAGFSCLANSLQLTLPEGYTSFAIVIPNAPHGSEYITQLPVQPYGYNATDIIRFYTVGGDIDTSIDNTFPLGGNLPELTQWEYMRNTLVLSGLCAQTRRGILYLSSLTDMLDISLATDWTNRIDASSVLTVRHRLAGWAQQNALTFKENKDVERNPGFSLTISDTTIPLEKKWIELDFAPSFANVAMHYKSVDHGATYEDVDIEPRFFKYDAATKSLNFTEDLYGEGLKAKYALLQAAIEKPVVIEATVRLTEIDLATLDLTRPVYLAQFGRYYHVLKVQTGKTNDCKVELLQIK